ncbi:SirB1 family protein [Motilimonas eburnea]|uniref:SirB1 family protein n=1 Tax=Motilimonas eburnea TaxID=1737488 RepID=UPI001E48CBEF|nr:tetratricopeptide repeat protein [Motilimonas eburnea]
MTLFQDQITELSLLDMALLIEQELDEVEMASVEAELTLLEQQFDAFMAGHDCKQQPIWQTVVNCFFNHWQFSGDWQHFFEYPNTQLSQVILTRKGIPLSLGILLLHFLKRVQVDAQGICFPGHFLVSITQQGERIILDPFDGKVQNRHQLELKLRGAKGDLARLSEQDLQADTLKDIIRRLLQTKKGVLLRENKLDLALCCSDLLLRLAPGDPFEIRDRGFIFHELDCYNVAVDDFNYFIDKCPDDPSISLLKLKIKQMDPKQLVMH